MSGSARYVVSRCLAATILLFAAFAGLLLANAAPSPRLTIAPLPEGSNIEVVAEIPESHHAKIPAGKITAELAESWLRLVVADVAKPAEAPAILGQYSRRENLLAFTPRYALVPGQRYLAIALWDPASPIITEHRVPARTAIEPARVEKIFPNASELPANQLKFYIHFSRPMRQTRGIFEQITLLGTNGRAVEDPWRRTELWNDDATRLTLLIHPGRIKQGIKLRELLGPVLETGRDYTLVIGAAMLDAHGQPLAREFTKKFHVTEPLRTPARVEDWKIKPPQTDTTAPLQIDFPRAMDRALLSRCLAVKDARGNSIEGRIEVHSDERSWAFHPHRPWRDTEYIVVADARLEDLAGNTPLRLFDAPFDDSAAQATELILPFHPRAR
jgi:hypothetical protein